MTLFAMVLVGLGSYVLRVTPVFVLPRLHLSPRVDRTIRHAGVAALTSLVVSALAHRDATGDLGPSLLAVVTGLAIAARGASMAKVVAAGGAVYVGAALVAAAVSIHF
jgi:branched-subunit amino acid transport protein